MKNKIEESYNKCLNLFKEGKRDTEEYRKNPKQNANGISTTFL